MVGSLLVFVFWALAVMYIGNFGRKAALVGGIGMVLCYFIIAIIAKNKGRGPTHRAAG